MNFFKGLIDLPIEKSMGICNVTDEFFCLILNKINNYDNKNILVVVNSLYEANKLYNSLSIYNSNTFLFPMDDFLTSEALAASPDLRIKRLETLQKTFCDEKCIIITNLMGYLRYLPCKKVYESAFVKLKIGDIIKPSDLVEKLVSCGYTRDSLVNKTGEFAVRGFVIDIFPIDFDNPIRIEFFDDEIESIRFFDSETQKSISNVDNITVNPFF